MLKAKVVGQRHQQKLNEAMEEVLREPEVRLNVNMPKSLYKALKARAAQDDVAISHLVKSWVNEYLSNSSNTHGAGDRLDD